MVCRKPRLAAAEPTLNSAIRMAGLESAFRILGLTAFLGNNIQLCIERMGEWKIDIDDKVGPSDL